MDLFARTFQRSIVDVKKLLSFGFREVGGVYEYRAPILEGSFEAEVFYSTDKGFYGRLIDEAVGEEYLLLNVDGVQGDFHNKVRNAFEELLFSIRASCTSTRRYKTEQAERIVKAIKKDYNVDPEWLWGQSFDDPSVFRHKDSLKWFGIIMQVPYSKFGRNDDSLTDVINVKLKPEEICELIKFDGYELAYHMNKKSWLSIILDDSQDDKEILSLIAKSYSLTERK